MIPNSFVLVDLLPLTANGKINRRALPIPDLESDLQGSFVPPRSDTEKTVAQIWADMLKLQRVGIHDNFFDLGGDSIIAMKIIAQIGRIFPWNITLAEFYEACTVALSSKLLIQKSLDSHQVEKIAALYLQIESMSSSEVDTLLANEPGDSARQDKNSARTED